MNSEPNSLSSPWTPLVKAIPAVLWLLYLALAVDGVVEHNEDRGLFILVLLIFTPIAAVWFWRYWRLMDRVELHQDQLRLQWRGVEQRVNLVDVLNVVPGPISYPTLVRIRMRKEGPFGDEIRFAARMASVSTWSLRLKAVEALLSAVDAAKLGARA